MASSEAPYIPRGFQNENSTNTFDKYQIPGGFIIEMNGEVFNFVDSFYVSPMVNDEERETVHKALRNYVRNIISIDTLKEIVASPGRYTSLGQAISAEPVVEKVDHPAHYNTYKGLEIIDLVEQLNFNRGNAIKYIARAGLKDPSTEIQDLEKARWYVNRELTRIKDVGDKYSWTADATELIEQMNYNRGSAVNFVSHAGTFDASKADEDLVHAIVFLDREINRMKKLEE